MNLAQLQAVLEVVHTGSVSAAAECLYLSQPAVTKQVRALEQELNIKLFERVGRGLVPTPAVHDVLPQIAEIFASVESVRNTLTGSADALRGRVYLGSGPILRKLLPEVIAACRQRYPNMQFVVSECPLEEQAEGIRNGELRLALGTDYNDDPQLAFQPLIADQLVLIMPKQHKLAQGRRPVPLQRLEQENIIAYVYVRMIERALRRSDISASIVRDEQTRDIRLRNTETIVAFVARGLGVSLVPAYMMKLVTHPNIVVRPIQEDLPVEFGYYHLRTARLTPAELTFIDVLQTVITDFFGHAFV